MRRDTRGHRAAVVGGSPPPVGEFLPLPEVIPDDKSTATMHALGLTQWSPRVDSVVPRAPSGDVVYAPTPLLPHLSCRYDRSRPTIEAGFLIDCVRSGRVLIPLDSLVTERCCLTAPRP